MLQLNLVFFLPIKNSLTAKKEAVYVAYLKASFLLVNLQIGWKGFFSGYHSQPNSTEDVPCSKRKSLPQPSPLAKIIILLMEAQFCFPYLLIMLKKTTPHWKTLRKGRGAGGGRVFSPCCKARGTPLLTKNQTFTYYCSLYQNAPFSHQDLEHSLSIWRKAAVAQAQMFSLYPSLSSALNCTSSALALRLGARMYNFNAYLWLMQDVWESCTAAWITNSSIKHVSVSR